MMKEFLGNSYLFAGEWWTCIFPSLAFCAIGLEAIVHVVGK